MRKVYSHENLTMVTSAKNLLELNNIDCFIKNEFHASGGHVGFEAVPVELWVHNDAERDNAVTLLEKELSAANELPDWTCQHCGEENSGSFETCWQCQKAPVVS